MNSKAAALIHGCIAALIATLALRECLSAQPQSNPDGAALFAANCGACHGSDARSGERAPNIATRREVVSLSDAELIRIVQNGIAGNGMPAFGYMGQAKVDAIVHHLRRLQGIGVAVAVPGDPRLGESLFFGKAECSNCHMVNGRGGYRAEELSGYGLVRSVEDVRASIIDPDRKLDRSAQHVTVVRRDGQTFVGFIRNQDNFSLVLQTEDGAFRLFSRDLIARIEYSGHSSMPRDYESRLSSKELDDLVSYLMKTNAEEKKTAKDDDE